MRYSTCVALGHYLIGVHAILAEKPCGCVLSVVTTSQHVACFLLFCVL